MLCSFAGLGFLCGLVTLRARLARALITRVPLLANASPLPPPRPSELPFGARALEALADDVELHWLVKAEGRRSRRGTRSDLRHDGDELVLVAALEPSWRTQPWMGTRAADGAELPLHGA